MTRSSQTLVFVALSAAFSSTAFAATIAGTITDAGAAGLVGAEVQLWEVDPTKGPVRAATMATGSGGGFTFNNVAVGTFRVMARMPNGSDVNLTDRWFDAAEPTAGGWNVDGADSISISSTDDAVTGVTIQLLAGGGAQGRVLNAGRPAPGMLIRFEQAGTTYAHHTAARPVCCDGVDIWSGRFDLRGLNTSDDYRLFLYDPTGHSETTVMQGPFSVSPGTTAEIGDISLVPLGEDPHEPNNSSAAPGVNSIPADLFRGDSPSAFISDGAIIGPMGEDVDWYCVNAMPHDRFIAYTSTDLGLPGEFVDNPWLDPVLSVWAGGTTLVVSNDDADGFGFNSVVDTGDIPFAGRYCFVVSSFGDTDWTGEGQQTGGRYTLVVELGNRFPALTATLRGGPIPPPPGSALINEGEDFRIDFTYSDPDDDVLAVTATLHDSEGTEVEDGFEFNYSGGTGSFLWTVPDDAAERSPYELRIAASDGEFTAEAVVLADPIAVNIPPFAPVPLAPADGTTTPTMTPTVTVENALDLDGDSLSYDLELYYGTEIGDTPNATANAVEGEDGTTSWVLEPIAENTVVTWRARADDSLESGTSEWSPAWTFVVNTINELADPPGLVKPDQDSIVPLRSPTLSATNAEDPDGDTLWLVYEIATDIEFSDVIRTSDSVLQSASVRTEWTVTPELEWGGAYYARVHALDSEGNATEFSNIRGFTIKANLEPGEPGLSGEIGAQCDGGTFNNGVPSPFIVPAISDPEGEPLAIDFRIYKYDADVSVDEPLFRTTIEQPAGFVGEHRIDVDPTLFEENTHYLVRIQANDTQTDSDWGECDFYVNSENEPPGPVEILSPTEGEELPTTIEDIRIVVLNAVDPDGTTPQIRWCIINEFAGDYVCTENPAEWTAIDQDSSGQTAIIYPQYYDGAEMTVQACAMDEAGLHGPVHSVSFTTRKLVQTITPAFCGCGVSPTPSERAGWFAIIGLVFAGLRRRPRSQR